MSDTTNTQTETSEEIETNAASETPELEAKPATREDDLDRALRKAIESTSKTEKDAPEARQANLEAEEEAKPEQEEDEIQPPAEFNAEEKAAWKAKDIKKIMSGFERVSKHRTSEFSRNQTRFQQEFSTNKQLADAVRPFIKAAGLRGKTAEAAIIEAVALVTDIKTRKADALREIAQHLNIDLAGETAKGTRDPEIDNLKSTVQQLQNEREAEATKKQAEMFGSVFSSLQAEKNASGVVRFPDFTDDETGIRRAGNIGSLLRSKEFVSAVQARIPGAGLKELVVEAYKVTGGRVVDNPEPSKSPLAKQEHIARAKRAAAIAPGRSTSGSSDKRGTAKTLDEAAELAFKDLFGR